MAIKARQILETAFDVGKAAFSAGEQRLRERRADSQAEETSGGPATVGATEPGKPGGPKSATAATESSTERPPAGRAKAPAAKPAKRKSTAKAAKKAPKAKRAATPKAAVDESKAD